ncbi:MAG: MgtC/SapB family protein [Rhodospirillales bacterium]
MPALHEELLDPLLRLVAAAVVGMAIGLNRDVNGKPTGMRTLGLVSLGAALIAVGTVEFRGLEHHPDALSRVVQGIIQGVLAGVGFIGAGAIMRNQSTRDVEGLTTAATVWVTATLGVACALAAWELVLIGVVLTFLMLVVMHPVERWLLKHLGSPDDEPLK